jgi:hypothetical protein
MGLKIIAAAAIAICDALVDLIDSGGAGHVKIYDGTRPTNPATAVTSQVLLADFTLPNPAFGNAAAVTGGAAATANAVTQVSGSAGGTASWFRVFNGSGTAIFDGDITVTAGGGDLTLSSVTIVSGNNVSITGFVYTQPKGY